MDGAGINNSVYAQRFAGMYIPDKEKEVREIVDAKDRIDKQLGIKECKTCKSRRYVDVSNDPGVSFKTPAYVPAGMSGVAVARHENEHVVREKARAEREGREVAGVSVNFIIGTCPECGRTYVAGGVTRVITVPKGHDDRKPEAEE